MLKTEQDKTLASSRMKYGFLAKMLFFTMDLFYGRKRTLSKFKVLEVIARVPYQAWEHVAYVAITHKYRTPDFARRIFDFVTESREQQDNEQWHLLILEEMVANQRDVERARKRTRRYGSDRNHVRGQHHDHHGDAVLSNRCVRPVGEDGEWGVGEWEIRAKD